MKHVYKVKIYCSLGLPKKFKMSSSDNIDEIIRKIRLNCNENLLTFRDLKNKFLNFDRAIINRIYVKEVK